MLSNKGLLMPFLDKGWGAGKTQRDQQTTHRLSGESFAANNNGILDYV